MNSVEREWQAHGLDCRVVMIPMGHRCGYVRVPKEHPFFGLSCGDQAPIAAANVADKTIEGTGPVGAILAASDPDEFATRVDAHIEVHGGLTYAGHTSGGDGEWWFGFDCAHAYDSPAKWTQAAVENEVEKMAAQLAAIGKGGDDE